MSRVLKSSLALSLVAVLILAAVPSALAARRGASQVSAGWTQIASGGLGNPDNGMLFPLSEFNGKAFCWVPGAGGNNPPAAPIWAYDGRTWTKAADDGFGDANNAAATPGTVFQGKFYFGTGGQNGGQLWRTADGSQWERVGAQVFSADDQNCIPLGVQGGNLIVAMDNYQNGARVWSYDGTAFTRINTDGFSEDGVSFSTGAVMDGKVNVVLSRRNQNTQEPVIPLVYEGGSNWTLGPKGFGDDNNLGVHVIYADSGFVYAGTDNVNGGQVWRFDGTSWSQVNIGSISVPANNLVLAFPWQGQLWVGTSNAINGPPTGPAKIYKQKSDGSFDAITTDGFGYPDNGIVFPSAVFEGQLLAGTFNGTGFQVWSYNIGPSIEALSPSGGPLGCQMTITGKTLGSPTGAGGNNASSYFVSFNGAKVYSSDATSWSDTEIELNVPEGASEGPVSVTTPLGTSNELSFLPTMPDKYYFAEGSTRDNRVDGVFDEWLCLMNPNEAAAGVKVTYMLAQGSNITRSYTVDARSRLTVDVESDVGTGQDVSILTESDKTFVAERTMYFDYHNAWDGGDAAVGAVAPASHWHFAEGTTRQNGRDGSFDEWLCLMNPSSKTATVTVHYAYDGVGKDVKFAVGPHSRLTRDVAGDVGRERDVSASVSSDIPIVAERPLYFDYHGVWPGGDSTLGATNTATDFSFAEGCTYRWANEWICLSNPSGKDANVTLTYGISGGSVGTQTLVVPAGNRRTVDVAAAAGVGKDVCTWVHSDQPIVAERSMYFDYGAGSWKGGTFASGAQGVKTKFYFAEGTTRSNADDGYFDEWISIENPGTKPANVKLTFMKKAGVNIVYGVQVPPRTRSTVFVNTVLGPDADASLLVECAAPIMVERPMYFDYHGFAEGGSITRGYAL
jgi:hypothetical protein